MNDRSIRQLAVSCSLVLFAVVKYIEPSLPDLAAFIIPGAAPEMQTGSGKLLAAAWSGIKIGILIVVLEHIFYKAFAKRFLGRWAYQSSTGNFAVADLSPTGFWAGGVAIEYSVSLFKTAEETIAALDKTGTSSPFGTAKSLSTSLKDRQEFLLVYQVSVGAENYDARKGILTLTLTADKNIVNGVWESTKVNAQHPAIDDKSVRTGDVKFFRPQQFKKKFDRSNSPLAGVN